MAADGPYNEHLVRDYGQLTLGLVVVTLVAVLLNNRVTLMAAALGWIAFGIPHLVYHVRHRHVFDTDDQVLSLTVLAMIIVVPLIALLAEATRSGTSPSRRRSGQAAADVRARLEDARRAPLPEGGMSPERADELASEAGSTPVSDRSVRRCR